MLFVDNKKITDPRMNLALEEYLLRHVEVDEPILLFYINEPSVIIGRNQNTLAEIDPDYIKANQIHVVRRLSGGGAVYHDLGNLNYSFITNGREDLHNFAKFAGPVLKVLHQLGVDAELRGKSDLFANDKKISGNAQYATSGRMFSHGTLLFNTSIEHMLKALNPRQVKIESKAIQSVRNFVVNIRELLDVDYGIGEFRQKLLEGIFGGDDIPTYELDESEWRTVRETAADRYHLWEWNYGRSPKFNVQKSGRVAGSKIDVRIDVDKGHIQGLKIYGDFASKRDVAELEEHLTGTRYDKDALAATLQEIDIAPYFGELPKSDLLDLLY